MKGVRALNKNVPVFKVSGKTGEGFAEVTDWIQKKAESAKSVHHHHHDEHSDHDHDDHDGHSHSDHHHDDHDHHHND